MDEDVLRWLDEEEGEWRHVVLPHTLIRDNFVSGDANGSRMRVRYFSDRARRFRAKAWFGPRTQGPPGHVHGGSMAAVLDEAMGGAAWLSGHTVVAAEIVITFKAMLPLETWCVVESRISNVDGRKVRTEAEIRDRDGRVYTAGKGLFVRIDASRFGDQADEVQNLFASPPVPAAAGLPPEAPAPGNTASHGAPKDVQVPDASG